MERDQESLQTAPQMGLSCFISFFLRANFIKYGKILRCVKYGWMVNCYVVACNFICFKCFA